MVKFVSGIATLAILTAICFAAQVRHAQMERGGEWLSWSEPERDSYVDGFISGYSQARLKACNAADTLFEIGQTHRLGDEQHPTEVPSGRCLAAVDAYTRFKYLNSAVDFSPYTNTITEFYKKHPEYSEIPFPFIMEFLSDGKYRTADQLYELARKGELHVIR